MTPERFAEIERVCQAVLDQPPTKRETVVAELCQGDPELRAEVEALLAGASRAASLLPVSSVVTLTPTLTAGTRLGPYEVLARIGAGGMGEVYKARDTRLGRDVAVKMLPGHLAADPDLLRRFEQEARAVAALSHPNIVALYDVGTHDGAPFLVSELLEGQTLGDWAASGGLTVHQAVDTAVQIAQGLAAAHEKGIIHRDLKPANVFLTRDGHVKILDFGIAKLTRPDCGPKAAAVTPAPVTETGAVLGTVGYMSPEQVRGLPCDHRADIFALGCVLYEMLSGQQAFKRATPADTLSAILKEDPPPLNDLRPTLSPGLQQIVDRCLEKRPEDRFSSAHDLGLALEAISTGPARAGRPVAMPTNGVRVAVTAGVRRLASPLARLSRSLRARRWVWLLGGPAVLLAVVVASGAVVRERRAAWVRGQALPELVRLADARDYWPAFLLARRIEAVVPDDPMLSKLQPRFAGKFSRRILPAGAKVLARPRKGGDADWVELGEAKGAPLSAPLGSSVFKVQSPGFEPREFAMTVTEFNFVELNDLGGVLALARRGAAPEGMVLVENPAKGIWLGLDPWMFDFAQPEHVGAFFVDMHEVTNRDYKRFVDAGGYQRRGFWKEPFEGETSTLSWEEAMALFRDTTGRPGPATWEVGTFPREKADYPVTGVSWYEAAAYAAFAGKRLPSVYHWAVASAPTVGGDFVPASNFSGKLAPVGSFRGSLNLWGLYDAAGNAREWCRNASGRERFALGGAADGPAYMFWNPPVTKAPFDRNPTTGFRCIKPVTPDLAEAQLDRPIARKAQIDLKRAKGFSADEWKSWRDSFLLYAKGPLDARTEWSDNTSPSRRMERVSFTAAYGNERVVAYLFLPTNVPPPWQAVIFWPGGYAQFVNSSENGRNTLDLSYWDYLVKDGRAVVYPILKDTFERGGRADSVPDDSLANCIAPMKDIFRSLDYLETRTDIRNDRIGYLGLSWGANAGPFVCAVEKRIKAAVFLGGLNYYRETLGAAERCSTPVLMINGRFDGFAETQAPLFRALGAPADQKRHVVFDADHSLAGFEKDVIRLNLEWFDRYLGPVR